MESTQPKSPTPEQPRRPWQAALSRMDQWCVAVALGIALVSMIGYWFAQGGATGQLIELDRATPLHAQFAVDVNEAEWAELAQLPGIGETLARRIVAHRQSAGKYLGKHDLMQINGIGPRTLERISPYLLPLPERTNVATHLPSHETEASELSTN